jgi:hypothetical protein
MDKYSFAIGVVIRNWIIDDIFLGSHSVFPSNKTFGYLDISYHFYPYHALETASIKKTKSGYPERTNGIECGSGFQPRLLISRLEAAPTEGLSNGTWTFQISRKQNINIESRLMYNLAFQPGSIRLSGSPGRHDCGFDPN